MTIGSRQLPTSRHWHFVSYQVPSLMVLIALGVLTLISLSHPDTLSLTQSSTLRTAVATASLLIALAACYVAFTEFVLYGMLSSLCVGMAFLVFAGSQVGLRLVPLLAGWNGHLGWAPFGWGVEDAAAGALLIAAAILPDRIISLNRRYRALGLGLAGVVLLATAVALTVYQANNATLYRFIQTAAPLISALLYFVGSVLFWRSARDTNRGWYFWLSLSLGLAGFSQIHYAIHQYPVTVVQVGDLLRLVSFTGILLALAAEWSNNYRGLRWQARELGAVHALSAAPDMRDVAGVVQHIVAVAGEALHARARISLSNRTGSHSPSFAEEAEEPLMSKLPLSNGRANDVATIDGLARQGDEVMVMGVPLQTPERWMGMLTVARASRESFSSHDVRLLRAFGMQASILLERGLLYEEIAAGAVLQERSRLAREIHDGLAQHLAFLKMRVSWLQRSSTPIEVQQLSDIERVLETALIEARHAITTLRSEPDGTSALEAITRYTEEFSQVSGLEVNVSVEEPVPDIGAKTRVELLRVVQEALNNVRKHAQATRVSIGIREAKGGVAVSIIDDGAGFVLTQSEKGHFGLEIMQERVESVAGQLDVTSAPNRGTEVTIWMPSRGYESDEMQPQRLGLIES